MRIFVLAIAWAWAATWAVAGLAQAPLAKPDLPLLVNGHVRAVAPLADGSVVIGGSFSMVNSVPRTHLAKLAPDGTLDPDWAPQLNNEVRALATDAAGNVYVGGNFTEVNGQTRTFLVRLSTSGSGALDPVWNPQVLGSVNAVILDGFGNVLVGGIFSTIGAVSRPHIARLSSAGAGLVDPIWNPSPDGVVTEIALGPAGSVLVAGGFGNIGGQARVNLAKVSESGAGLADPTWDPGLAANAQIDALATDGSGRVYVGGYFTTIGGATRPNLARLSGSGTGAADAWAPGAGGFVLDVAIGPDGMIYAVGDFVVVNGSMYVNGIARFSPTTADVDPNWRPLTTGSSPMVVNFAADGDALIGGAFRSIEGQEAAGFVRIDAAAPNVVLAASTDQPGSGMAVLRQADGGLVVGGRFWKVGSVLRNGLARFRPDGALDLDWDPAPNGSIVYALAQDASGRVYIGGDFTTIGGAARSRLARYAWTGGVGTLDPDWDPQPNGAVLALAVDTDGSVYAGGGFSQIGGLARTYIAKLSGTGSGSAVAGWNGSADERVLALAIAPTGEVHAGAFFSSIGGQPLPFLARLSGTTGAADPIWAPTPDHGVRDILIGADGSIYVAGAFTQIGPYSRNHLARIVAAGSGTPYAAWNPAANAEVFALAADSQGNIYVGGDFSIVGGESRRRIAKLSGINTGAADPQWNPGILGSYGTGVDGLAASADRLDVVGTFELTGGLTRGSIASFSTVPGYLFADGFE
ncbi:MAG: delta-60 repeat domain-containing protein [Xanthomonadales bacterium]|nr:delta-60 repeat domain-containing protein [Xanthomonadales bacterium]